MTHRCVLLETLDRYLALHPDDLVRVDHIRQFVRQHADCLSRSCVEGHLTGSAWIVSRELDRVLLVHHRRLGRWLQPGGHADGEPLLHRVALREAREETGLVSIEIQRTGGEILPIDVDVHRIPRCGAEPAHLHHDVRYLLLADPDERLQVSDESHDVRWFEHAELEKISREESLLRMARRARDVLEFPS
jgi:8-oxo-dGTP pyrophosphatase MutT (NUDIX family)